MSKKEYRIPELSKRNGANSMAESVQETVGRLHGVNSVSVDNATNTLTIDYNEEEISSSAIQAYLEEANFI